MPFDAMELFKAGSQLGQAQAGPASYATENLMDVFNKQMQLRMMLGLKAAENQLPLNPTIQRHMEAQTSYLGGMSRRTQQQDRLEQNARQAVTSVKGDIPLQRIEMQRDAASIAYNTLDRIRNENRLPSKMEYYDTMAQLYKARTGQAPTDQIMNDLDTKTFQGDLLKGASYWFGKPMGNTTQDILNNMQGFVKDSGMQADSLHEGYMKAHLIKPSGLEDSRWEPIRQTARGKSFAEATGLNKESAFTQATGTGQTSGKRVSSKGFRYSVS